ncbi:MAG: hypothetical protein WC741_01740 [Patescibacteria group bacterium]|jgi:hypothetical protein
MDNHETSASRSSESSKKSITQAEAEASQILDQDIKKINDLKISEQDKQERKDNFGENLKLKALEQLEQLEAVEKSAKNKTNDKEIIAEKSKTTSMDLRRMTIAAKKGIKVHENPKTQNFIENLAEKQLSDDQIIAVFKQFEEYLLGRKEITLSSSSDGQNISQFEEDVLEIENKNPEAAQKIIDSLVENASNYGKEKNEVRKRFGKLVDMINSRRMMTELEQTIQQYFPNFPEKQKEFLRDIHDPERFLKLIDSERARILTKRQEIEDDIKIIYKQRYEKDPTPEKLNELIDRQVRIEISEEISRKMIDVYEQLYYRLNIEVGHKTFDETEKEDFMHGIEVVRFEIYRSLQHLDSTFREMEEADSSDPRLIKLYRLAEEDKEIIDIKFKGNEQPVVKLKPLPYFKEVSLADFMINQLSNFGHWREKTSYFQDTAYIFGHPPHEGVFYAGLGEYAEKMDGVGLDGIMNLPDAKLSIEAFHLYDKFLEDALAKIDYKIDATLLTNKYEEINTQLEEKIMEYLRLKYGKNITEIRLLRAIRCAVGMSQGIFLTQPEKMAFTDPTDHKGRGAFQSYSTNDAGALMALNPLHLIMRWQSDANLRQVFFMEADGTEYNFIQNLFGKGYEHKKAWKNAAKYMNSFFKLECGREGSKRNLIIDKILNLSGAAGIYERRGWRSFYQFESHLIYNENNDGIKLLESFQSMDVIGYEAVNWFLKSIDDSFYQAYETTYMEKVSGPEAAQREELFKHVYKKYFAPFSSQSYEDYIAGLKTKAKDMVNDYIKKNKTLPFDNKVVDDYDKAVQKEISNLFVKGAVSRFVAARFPTKFLRIDRNRYQASGKSRWRQMYETMKTDEKYKNFNRDQFDEGMQDLLYAEELLMSTTSERVQKSIHLLPLDKENDPNRSLGDYSNLLKNLDRETLIRLLESNGIKGERQEKAVYLYDLINKKFLVNKDFTKQPEFLDGEAVEAIEKYPFSFGIENTDMKLIAYRGTGRRMIARQIKDIAAMEKTVINGFIGLPEMFKGIAKSGDFAPLIEYLKKCQATFTDVHGVKDAYAFNYMVSGMLINYLRKSEAAKSFFGLGGIGSINSIAGEVASNSNLVREWDSREIDRLANELQREGLLPGTNIDLSTGPEYQKIWKIDKITKLPKQTGRMKRLEKYDFNIKRLRERFGGDAKAMGVEILKDIFPLVLIFVLWQYLKKALEESFGPKKG